MTGDSGNDIVEEDSFVIGTIDASSTGSAVFAATSGDFGDLYRDC